MGQDRDERLQRNREASLERLKPFQFKPGQTGNASGRPKGLERAVRDAIAAREWTDADGTVHKGLDAVLARLFELLFAKGTTPRDAVALAKEIFDRGFGKAKQKVEMSGDASPAAVKGRKPEEMTTEEMEDALDAIRTLRRIGAVAAADDVSEH